MAIAGKKMHTGSAPVCISEPHSGTVPLCFDAHRSPSTLSIIGAIYNGKKLSYVKYSSKRSDFLRFYLYLCHVIDDFACLELQH